MLSKEQAAEKEKKILKCVRTFLKSNGKSLLSNLFVGDYLKNARKGSNSFLIMQIFQ